MKHPMIDRIAALFDRAGRARPDDRGHEAVSALEHSLQCAQLAEWAGSPPELVAAALLHDIGHLLDGDGDGPLDDDHARRAVTWLHGVFGPAVTEPIRLHVQAKRYIAAEPAYRAAMGPASVLSLALQGGPMSAAERRRFANEPYAEDALQLRRWDDAAREPGRATPPLDSYLVLLGELLDARTTGRRVPIAALAVA